MARNASETPRGKTVNDHVRGHAVPTAYGGMIPHGVVPQKKLARGVTEPFQTMRRGSPFEPISTA